MMDQKKTPEDILTQSKTFMEVLAGFSERTLIVWVVFLYVAYDALTDAGATELTVSVTMGSLALVTAAYIFGHKIQDAVKGLVAPKAAEVAMVAQETKASAKTFKEGKPPEKS